MFNLIEIVVARYNEDLNWTKEYPFNQFKYTIYNKGSNTDFVVPSLYRDKIIQLPNVGRCDHTYLYHIVKNYNKLADLTNRVDRIFDEMKSKKLRKLILLDGHGRTVYLFCKKMITNNYYFDIDLLFIKYQNPILYLLLQEVSDPNS